MKSILKVTKVTDRKDKGTNNFRTIELSTPDKIKFIDEFGDKQIIRQTTKTGTINAWEESYLDGKMEYGYDFEVGEQVYGDIVTRETEGYEIPEKIKGQLTGDMITVNTYTCVVFGDSDDEANWEAAIQKAFRRQGKVVLGSAPIEKKTPMTGINQKELLDKMKADAPKENESNDFIEELNAIGADSE